MSGNCRVWTIPPERMKAKESHSIPLSARCLEILAAAKEISCGREFVFPGRSVNKPLSNMAFNMVTRPELNKMAYNDGKFQYGLDFSLNDCMGKYRCESHLRQLPQWDSA
jgi:hypothetical protein